MPRRQAALLAVALAALACSGVLPAPPPPPEPDPVPAPAPPPPRQRTERDVDCLDNVVGVLTHVPGFPAGHDGKPHPGPITFYARPEPDAKPLATLDDDGQLARADGELGCKGISEEPCLNLVFENEGIGLPVYDTSGSWVQVAIGKGGSILDGDARCRRRAWVQLDDPMTVETVPDLLESNKLTHTLDDWNGVLYDSPDGAPRASGFTGQTDFTVKSSRRFAGRLWFEVDLVSSHCDTPRDRGTGWIPLEDDDGRLQIWFYTDC